MSLTVKFKGDSSSFDKALNRVKTGVKSVSTPITAAAKGVAVLGAAFTAAAVAAAAFTFKMVKIGEEANTQNARLQNVVKQMGIFGGEAGKVSDRLSKFAEAQARLIGVDDGVIKRAQAKLSIFQNLAVTADEAGGAFDRATIATLNLSAMGMGSAEESAIKLGRALQDPVKNLNLFTRAGIEFTEAEKQKIAELVASNNMLEAQDEILKKIEGSIGGTAEATANATEKLATMRQQLLNAFAKPVADAFARATVNAEKMFLELEAKFEEAGQIFGNALERMLEGDASRFVEIGKLIGQLILDGIDAAWNASGWTMAGWLSGALEKMTAERDGYNKGAVGGAFDSWLNEQAGKGVASAGNARSEAFTRDMVKAIENLNENIAELRRQRMEDALYNAGWRDGAGNKITDEFDVPRMFKEYLEEQKKTNAYLEREEQDRKGL